MSVNDQLVNDINAEYSHFIARMNLLKELINSEKNIELAIVVNDQKFTVPNTLINSMIEYLSFRANDKEIKVSGVDKLMTTQQAADFLGFSRPHMVKILENGLIDFIKVGKHRRIKLYDLLKYKSRFKFEQRQILVQMMEQDEAEGFYDNKS